MMTHSLTLEFGRVLTEAEWRIVVERAWQMPYVQTLRADATELPRPIDVTDSSDEPDDA